MQIIFKIIFFPIAVTWWLIKLPFRILMSLLIGLFNLIQVLFALAIIGALGYGLLLLAGPFFALGGVVGGIMFMIWVVFSVIVEPTVAKMEAEREEEKHQELIKAITK